MSQPPSNQTKLKFRIIFSSGEEPDYPATELLSQSPSSKGWQSTKYCEYPQEMALQFLNPVRIRQVQFLSHQCKIASKIELFVYMPDALIPPNNREIRYKKLGYLSLDSNERSGYQSRELKSVYIDTPCQYLKLIFNKCHLNKYNLFNQVGLIALSVFGEPLNAPGGLNQQKGKEFFNEIQFETQFDPTTLERMRALEEAKERAIQNEDFLEAKRIKEAIERLKQIGMQLRQLEERKSVAIQNEDYDSANIIKQEIAKLRNAVAPESLIRQPEQQQQQQYPNLNQHRSHDKMFPQSNPTQQRGADDMQLNNYDQEPQQPLYQQQHDVQYQQRQHEHHEEENKIEPDYRQEKGRQTRKQQILNIDDQIIPAMANKMNKNEDEFEGGANNNQNFKIDNLVGENFQQAQSLIPILTEDCCKKMFSKSWNTKEESLKWLETQIARPTQVAAQDPSALFVAIMGAVSYTINDKVAAVYGRSISVLQALLAKHLKLKVAKKGEFNEYTDNTIQGVMEKLGDTNPRIKEQAEIAMRMLAEHPSIGPLICVNHLMKGISIKLDSSIKHLNGRLFILQEYIKQFEIGNASMPFQPIVDFTLKQLEHQNEGIRTSAMFVLVEIYKHVGDKLRGQLNGVRPAQMELLEKFFSEINGGGNIEKLMEEQKMIVSTHIDHQGPNNANNSKPAPKKPPQQAQAKVNSQVQKPDEGSICEFCERVDRDFKDTNKLDIHLWKECFKQFLIQLGPMLTTCTQCAQVVEIAAYTIHLLEECDQHRNFKRCPRCKQATHIQNYDKHVDEKSCVPSKPLSQANRCPLCHMDTKSGPEGWRQHLVQQGCPNNERTAG